MSLSVIDSKCLNIFSLFLCNIHSIIQLTTEIISHQIYCVCNEINDIMHICSPHYKRSIIQYIIVITYTILIIHNILYLHTY